MANERRGGGFFGGFVIGATVGALVAIALTREDARDMLIGKAKEATSFAKEATDDLRGKVSDAATHWQTNASDLYERGRQVVEDARNSFEAAEPSEEPGHTNSDV